MKRIISFMLLLVMVCAALSGCGASTGLEGSWQATIDLGSYVESQINDEAMQKFIHIKDFSLEFGLTLNADQSFTAAIDEAAAKKAYEKAKEAFASGAKDYLQSAIDEAGGGVSVDELLALSGTTLEAMAEQAFGAENLSAMIEPFKMEGTYRTEGEKLYLSYGEEEIEFIYELSGQKLILSEGSEALEAEGLSLYPLEFKKQK